MDIVIKELSKAEYEGFSFNVDYETSKYYDVALLEEGFQLVLKEAEQPMKKGFDGSLFSKWLEEPVAYGAFEGDKLIGFVEGSGEEWHNMFRVSNIFVYEEYRGMGIGVKLLAHIIDKAKAKNKYRGIVLETQSCNYRAICLYKKLGFKLSRIDINEYTNNDVENREIRIDLSIKF